MNKIVDDAIAIATREGRAPEQEDFMTAAVLNQRGMSAEDRRWLQADLRAAELGTSSEGLCDCSDLWEDESGDDLCGETCPDCGNDLNYCTCRDAEPIPEKYFNLHGDCPRDWYSWRTDVPESEVESEKQRIREEHVLKCGCGDNVAFDVSELGS